VGQTGQSDRQPVSRQLGRITLLRQQNALLLGALAATRQAVITLGPEGTMLLCTRPARRYLARYFPTADSPKPRLPEKLRFWIRQQDGPPSKDGSVSPPRPPLVIERDGGRLTVHLLCDGASGRHILLLQEMRHSHSLGLLQRRLSLTPREAEVLFWVSQGKKNSAIAIILGVSTATVEKHLEHILAKLMVETRTAAALLAYEVLSSTGFQYPGSG
jgi:DNA-binding CsgD family transcriptional regulator